MKPNIRAKVEHSTQDHLEIREIIDDIVLTKSGSCAIIIQTTAVNFDLLSEFEQDNKIYAFAGLLNSLNFHIQILIRTNRIDISKYIDYLKIQENQAMSEGLKKQLGIYTKFIDNLIVQNDVLDKKFYIVIPYTPTTTLPTLSINQQQKEKERLEELEKQKFKMIEQAKIFLMPKRDHMLKQLSRMGLMGHQLNNNNILELMYNIYNPSE
jgi:hypothetical protein